MPGDQPTDQSLVTVSRESRLLHKRMRKRCNNSTTIYKNWKMNRRLSGARGTGCCWRGQGRDETQRLKENFDNHTTGGAALLCSALLCSVLALSGRETPTQCLSAISWQGTDAGMRSHWDAVSAKSRYAFIWLRAVYSVRVNTVERRVGNTHVFGIFSIFMYMLELILPCILVVGVCPDRPPDNKQNAQMERKARVSRFANRMWHNIAATRCMFA